MVWVEIFYNANIPFAAAQFVSFRKAVKMMSKIKRPYFSPSYHNICKKLLNDTKNKIKV
jgi:hypothetical protein